MKIKNKKCALILPYFGEFNNYFPLFLKSCAANPSYDWIIITDNPFNYECPENVHVISSTLESIRWSARQKLGFDVALKDPYKLCDYKPAYGLLFEKYLEDYEYWGHCDCDLIFGNLEKLLTPLLNKEYDKIFAAGHLTIYRNSFENNRRFMKTLNGRYLYREAYKTDSIFAFDEDCSGHDNVHSIFLKDGANVYEEDLSMNSAINSAKYIRDFYDKDKHEFSREEYRRARYYWNHGNIIRIECENGKLINTEFLYFHFQMRKMRARVSLGAETFEILPDRFVQRKIPMDLRGMNLVTVGFPYLYWVDNYQKKVRRLLKKYKKRKSYDT